MSNIQNYIDNLSIIKKNNEDKLLKLIDKLEQCNKLEVMISNKVKYSFLINDKLNKIQHEMENLFFNICKNINLSA